MIDLDKKHADALKLSHHLRNKNGWSISAAECALMLDVAERLGIVQNAAEQAANESTTGERQRDGVQGVAPSGETGERTQASDSVEDRATSDHSANESSEGEVGEASGVRRGAAECLPRSSTPSPSDDAAEENGDA